MMEQVLAVLIVWAQCVTWTYEILHLPLIFGLTHGFLYAREPPTTASRDAPRPPPDGDTGGGGGDRDSDIDRSLGRGSRVSDAEMSDGGAALSARGRGDSFAAVTGGSLRQRRVKSPSPSPSARAGAAAAAGGGGASIGERRVGSESDLALDSSGNLGGSILSDDEVICRSRVA